MSLESYLKTLEDQRRRETQEDATRNTNRSVFEQAHQQTYIAQEKPKHRSGCGCLIIFIVAILIIAAIKNPSGSEAKQEVKTFLIEKINNNLRLDLTNDGIDSTDKVASFFGMALAPAIVEYMVQIDVSDNIIFSTFSATFTYEDKKHNVASGIIVFGKVIPLSTDIKREYWDK